MMETSGTGVPKSEIDALYEKTKKDAGSGGYYLNPDAEFTRELIESLLKNKNRYGYKACPCRLAAGVKIEDLDIICPCDYRDADVDEYGACYCALYVSKEAFDGSKKIRSIPERRPAEAIRKQKTSGFPDANSSSSSDKVPANLKYPVWRCSVCGYLCARDNPPGVCPICKAAKERFERFL
jgi:ferredoxin-thioredoxin reductase catalytic subunit